MKADTTHEMVERTCHVCGTSRHVVRRYGPADVGPGSVYSCRGCGMAFFVAENGWTPDYWIDANFDIYSRREVVAELDAKYSGYLRRVRRAGLPGARLLDVGCGIGICMRTARALGFQPSGIDIAAKAVEYTRRHGLNAVAGTLETVSFAPATFDVITCWDVIEHVEDPRSLLQRAHTLLVEGGALILETPDESALLRKPVRVLNAVTRGRVNHLARIYYPDHRWYFSRAALGRLLAEVGFRRSRFLREGSMVEKSKGKRRALGPPGRVLMDTLEELAMTAMRRVPLLGNKIVAFAWK